MSVTRIRLRDFRRYQQATFDFEPGTVFVEGENNAGKTSLFLAIEYALFGNAGSGLGPHELMRPGAKGVGVELHFTGRDARLYRLQRVHLRPPKSRTRVVGHFTLWVCDDAEEAERYLLSSDFEDLETDLALAVKQALGVTRRGWDLAMHLRQGQIPQVLHGAPELDRVLGVSASVFVEEELRSMALEQEKASAELPALQATLARIEAERVELQERAERLTAEARTQTEADDGASTRAAQITEALRGLRAAGVAADALQAAERRLASALEAHTAAAEALAASGERDDLQQAVRTTEQRLTTLAAARSTHQEHAAEHAATLRQLAREQGDLEGQLKRQREIGALDVCDRCGQPIAEGVRDQIPQLEAALAEHALRVAETEQAKAAAQEQLTALAEGHAEARLALADAERALTAHDQTEATAQRAHRALDEARATLDDARAAARDHLQEADDDTLLASLRRSLAEQRDQLVAEQGALRAAETHAAEQRRRLQREVAEVERAQARLAKESADVSARCSALQTGAARATKLRVLAKAFKQVQEDLREQATRDLATRTHAIHTHLTGDDRELRSVDVDPKRYVVHVTPRDIGRRVPAAHAQGGGHRLLLGLATRLALAEHLGPVPFVLLDEPTYGLDAARRAALLKRISSLRVAEQLLLITHHDLGDAERVVRVVRDGDLSHPQGAP
ncbi:MAG: AAA family ATPase [Myxococcales bacterium]|nr:AAA family ATPase [Myxococcales bacterium]